jgi:hypothetical protein
MAGRSYSTGEIPRAQAEVVGAASNCGSREFHSLQSDLTR